MCQSADSRGTLVVSQLRDILTLQVGLIRGDLTHELLDLRTAEACAASNEEVPTYRAGVEIRHGKSRSGAALETSERVTGRPMIVQDHSLG